MRPGRGGREADEPDGAADSVGLGWGEVGATRQRAAGPKGFASRPAVRAPRSGLDYLNAK
jgi:hypothetical protein